MRHLILVQFPPTIYTSHQCLEEMHWFQAIFKIFGLAVFEAIEVKGRSMLNFEATTLKFCNIFWKLGCQPQKRKCRPLYHKRFKSFDLFVFFVVPPRPTLGSNAKRKISKSNKSELWNCLSTEVCLPFFKVGSQTFRNDYKNSR